MIQKFHQLLEVIDGLWEGELSLIHRHFAPGEAGGFDPCNEDDWAYESFPTVLVGAIRERK